MKNKRETCLEQIIEAQEQKSKCASIISQYELYVYNYVYTYTYTKKVSSSTAFLPMKKDINRLEKIRKTHETNRQRLKGF